MPMTSQAPEMRPRWSVDIPIRTRTGGTGTHTFIIRAVNPTEAVAAAWDRAHTADAVGRRNGATLTAGPGHLTAQVVPGGLY
jgi:hypothetical protein